MSNNLKKELSQDNSSLGTYLLNDSNQVHVTCYQLLYNTDYESTLFPTLLFLFFKSKLILEKLESPQVRFIWGSLAEPLDWELQP